MEAYLCELPKNIEENPSFKDYFEFQHKFIIAHDIIPLARSCQRLKEF